MSNEIQDNRVPVTIITGFLGSGKTTLLNHLIATNQGLKIAIIENEFGEIGLDSELVVGVNENLFELKNGCVCCSLNGELSETMHDLITKVGKIDHLIIETTGVADPGPIALSFVTDFKIQDAFRLDAIVALVDAQFISNQLKNTMEAGRQIGIADIIVINKLDRTNDLQLQIVKDTIKSINPESQVYTSSFGKVKGINLLKAKPFSSIEALKQIGLQKDQFKPKFLQKAFTSPIKIHAGTALSLTIKPIILKPLANMHTAITSHSFQFNEPLDMIKFDHWMSRTLELNGNMIYRIKGIINFHQVADKVVFQAVHSYFITSSAGEWNKDENRVTRIVFIGRELTREDLEIGLKGCQFSLDEVNSYHIH